MTVESYNCVRVSRTALQNNFELLKEKSGQTVPLMAMVKADGYGHGMVESARAFSKGGCRSFGVAELCEAVALRKSGLLGDIYVTIGFRGDDADLFFEYQLIPVIYSVTAAEQLSARAVAHGRAIGVHIKVDTGMGRLGILPHETMEFVSLVSSLPGLKISGVMSHFPESDDPTSVSTKEGLRKFGQVCGELKTRFGAICHIANSGAVLNFADTRCDMVRAGIALYGYHPAGRAGDRIVNDGSLIPAMSYSTQIIQVKKIPAGTGISYGHTFITNRETILAVLPVGYEDGYSRGLSNCGEVLVHGVSVPVRGRICMNMCMVDVTGIDGVSVGDEVVLLGKQGKRQIDADDLADKLDSISYEVLCKLGNNNNRIYT